MNSEEPTARSFFGQRHADPGDMLLKRVTEEEEKTIVPQLSFLRKATFKSNLLNQMSKRISQDEKHFLWGGIGATIPS